MCTVTFIPSSTGYYLTSNRDESTTRPTLLPSIYQMHGQTLLFPRDEVAGGTWIALSDKGRAACLLNGAFVKHKRENSYRKSRGLVLLDSFLYPRLEEIEDKMELSGIEPFTLLLIEKPSAEITEISELRWDGVSKHCKKLPSDSPLIWSSATLYEPDIIRSRHKVFHKWTEEAESINSQAAFDFHSTRHGLKQEEDIVMKKNDHLMTISVSQIVYSKTSFSFRYYDLMSGANREETLAHQPLS